MRWRLVREIRRLRRERDEGGSLALVMVIIMVGLASSAVLIPTMITQDRATVYSNTHMRALSAARAGVDLIVGQIRAAVAGGVGDPSKLPCAVSAAPVVGATDGAGSGSYSVYVTYYVTDPVQNPAATPMLCVPGAGTYDTSTGAYVPAYAQITSTGTNGVVAAATTGGSLGRTIVSTYVFQTTNSNVAGGQVRIYPPDSAPTTPAMCLDAGSTAPVAGTVLTLQPCSTSSPVAAQQQFSYRSDLTLQLAPVITSAFVNGLCVDTSTTSGGPVSGNTAFLAPCSALGSPNYSQQWSFNDNGEYEASTSTSASSGALANLCITVTDQSTGRQSTLAACGYDGQGITSPTQAWVPSPSVGNGAAAAPQLVNFQQFGRCLDVTGQNASADHLIAYPCKQNPLSSAVAWNQKFTYSSSTGWISTTTGGVQYCIVSPRTELGLTRMTQCNNPSWVPGVTAAQLQWTSFGSSTTLPYAQRYTFVDSSTTATRCLSIVAPPTSDPAPWYYIDVATCDGSTAQKWNANPTLGRTLIQNTVEK
jgi:hypothetical protein